MAHYAFLDENNVVTQVIVGIDEGTDGIDWEERYTEIKGQKCKRTSYGTVGGKHSNGKTPFRKNYACIGFTYDETLDAFIPPKPFPSWVLNPDSCLWDPPIPYPDTEQRFVWDESEQNWVSLTTS